MCLIVNGREATTLLPDLTYELAVSLASLDVSRRPTVVCRLRSIGQEITPGFSVPVCNGLVVNVAYTDAA